MRGFRRPPCPPVPCLGNPESPVSLTEVRLHGASSAGMLVFGCVCFNVSNWGLGGGVGVALTPSVFWGVCWGCFQGLFGVWRVFLDFFGVFFGNVQLLRALGRSLIEMKAKK